MEDIYVYDIGDNRWYMQKATGDIPGSRARFGAGAAEAPDRSSFNM
jgi:hypothetical protein